ncbi:MAG TPA: hypothetical protein VG308_11930 [Stellaceae bacterium]|jgi:hypothetical protein|nr:hypothetical protein [Stellaceae bacterium]
MLLVEIEKPANEPLSAWFAGVRQWLETNDCDLSAVILAGRRIDRLIYRVSFDNAATAHRFVTHFRRYAPAMRRATAFEREQLRARSAAQRVHVTASAAD